MTFDELVGGDVNEAARGLIGWTFLVDGVGGRIVEVEAYDQEDAASHALPRADRTNRVMFGKAGHLYVYRSYGIHWCANVVCGPVGHAAAVLLRALEPTHGLGRMRVRRGVDDDRLLCSGPGRLTQALAVTGERDGARSRRAALCAPAARRATAQSSGRRASASPAQSSSTGATSSPALAGRAALARRAA